MASQADSFSAGACTEPHLKLGDCMKIHVLICKWPAKIWPQWSPQSAFGNTTHGVSHMQKYCRSFPDGCCCPLLAAGYRAVFYEAHELQVDFSRNNSPLLPKVPGPPWAAASQTCCLIPHHASTVCFPPTRITEIVIQLCCPIKTSRVSPWKLFCTYTSAKLHLNFLQSKPANMTNTSRSTISHSSTHFR